MENKANHQANVVRITEILPHNNADTLVIIPLFDGAYQVVTKKDEFKVGDLAVYIQPDSVVPQSEPFKFIWENYVGLDGTVPEKRRRITVKKLRKEWSEGLLVPLSEFPYNYLRWDEGMDVSDDLNITHYEPEETTNTRGTTATGPRRRYPKTLKGWFFFLLHKLGFKAGLTLTEEVSFHVPSYDVEALKNHKNTLQPGELVVVTEKLHGSNARYLFLDGKMYAGSHYQWKAPNSPCIFRKALVQNPWIETWCRAHEGVTLFGELTPTQKGFNYGCTGDQIKFFVFDLFYQDGTWKKPWLATEAVYGIVEGLSANNIVPLIYHGPFNEEVWKLADGPSLVEGAQHVREGVVISPFVERIVRGMGRVQLKLVSNIFLEKDSK